MRMLTRIRNSIRMMSLSILPALLVAGAGAEVPDEIRNIRGRIQPAWVSLEKAAPDGFFDGSLFRDDEQDSILGKLAMAPSVINMEPGARNAALQECTPFTIRTFYGIGYNNIEELIETSRFIYSGTVTAIKQGFYVGLPGTLFEFEINDVLKGENPPAAKMFYIFMPYIRAILGGSLLCYGSRKPEIGSKVIFFTGFSVIYDELPVFRAESNQLIYSLDGEKPVAPERIRELESLTFSQIIAGIKQTQEGPADE